MSFVYDEKKRNSKMVVGDLFNKDGGNGKYKDKKVHPYILQKGENNLYEKIRHKEGEKKLEEDSAVEYFNKYNIQWHDGKDGKDVPTNTLESQVSCINHLFPIRNNPEAVKSIINGLGIRIKGERVEFDEVLPIMEKEKNGKADQTYIAFEVIEKMALLGERGGGRGWRRTSIDALIYAKEKEEKADDKKKWIIIIEWKYKEFYINPENLATEGRRKRYNKLIQKSSSLIPLCEKGKTDGDYSNADEYKEENCVYYYEPYYELMRQTLWAELVTGRIKKKPKRKADGVPNDASDYLHICVVPKKNRDFLDKGFKDVGRTIEETWRRMLTGEGTERFKIIDPEELFAPLKVGGEDPDPERHINYLKERYWDNEFAEYFNTVVDETVKKLSSREPDLKDIYNRYAEVVWARCHDDNYFKKGEEIKSVIKNCGADSVLQLYNSKTWVEDSKYDVRLYGHHYCDEGVAINSLQDGTFFTNFPPKANNDEFKLQALILGEMDKENSRVFENMKPVKVGAGFFEMTTPLKASAHEPIISIAERKSKKGENSMWASGGPIDILAKVSCPNGGWAPAVIEVKDENNPDEPVEAVMTQALIYATFLGHLLADKDCGETWYNIIGGKGEDERCSVPDTIDILVVAMMPPKKYGEPDKINETPIPLKKVGDKNIRLIPCTCYIDTDENFTTINSVEWSCFKKNG